MDRADTQSFIGIMVPRQQASDLGRLQSSLRLGSSRFEPIPQRWLNLTLDDLGTVDPAALEAAALACSRLVDRHQPFTLRTGGLRQLGAIVALMIDDPQDRLMQLRAALHEQLDAYGFTLDPRPFLPHIALGRGAPALNITAPTLAFKINTIRMLTHVPTEVAGLPWQVRWRGDLSPAPQVSVESVPSEERDAEIRAELETRITARAAERVALRERQARAPKPEPTRTPRSDRSERPERPERPDRDRGASGQSGQRPAKGPSGQRPAKGPSGQRPAKGSSGQRPAKGPSGQRPAKGPSGQRPAKGSSGQRPAKAPSGERPAQSPPGDHADADTPRPKRRRRRRRSGGRPSQSTPKESS
ncbi:MAG: 2'-5' RNA ligase [Bradymonadia bacterium]|jgi:2'-5' RNA ligase